MNNEAKQEEKKILELSFEFCKCYFYFHRITCGTQIQLIKSGKKKRREEGRKGSNFMTFYWNLYTGGIYLLNVVHTVSFSFLSYSLGSVCDLREEERDKKIKGRKRKRKSTRAEPPVPFFSHLHSKHLEYLFREWNFDIFFFFWQIAIYGFYFTIRITHTDKHTSEFLSMCMDFFLCLCHCRRKVGSCLATCLLHPKYFCYWSMLESIYFYTLHALLSISLSKRFV